MCCINPVSYKIYRDSTNLYCVSRSDRNSGLALLYNVGYVVNKTRKKLEPAG